MGRTSYAECAAALTARPPASGAWARIVLLDGRSGAGKTTLLRRLRPFLAAAGAVVVELESCTPGWNGLAAAVRAVSAGVIEPVADGRPGSLRRWDWVAGRAGAALSVPPVDLLVVEGNGVAAAPARALASCVVWVDAPDALRSDRLDAREDAPLYAPYRAMWARQEEALVRAGGGPAAADVVVRAMDADTVTLFPLAHPVSPGRGSRPGPA